MPKSKKNTIKARSEAASFNKSEERKAYTESLKKITDRFAFKVNLSAQPTQSNEKEKAFTSKQEYLDYVFKNPKISEFGNDVYNIYDSMRADATEYLVEVKCGNDDDYITNKEDIYRALRILGDDDLDCTLGYIDPMSPASKYVDYITIFKTTKRGVEHLITMNKVSAAREIYPTEEEKRELHKRSLFILKTGRYKLNTLDLRSTLGITAANILHDKIIA